MIQTRYENSSKPQKDAKSKYLSLVSYEYKLPSHHVGFRLVGLLRSQNKSLWMAMRAARNIEPMSMGHLAKIKARIEQDMNVRIEFLGCEFLRWCVTGWQMVEIAPSRHCLERMRSYASTSLIFHLICLFMFIQILHSHVNGPTSESKAGRSLCAHLEQGQWPRQGWNRDEYG